MVDAHRPKWGALDKSGREVVTKPPFGAVREELILIQLGRLRNKRSAVTRYLDLTEQEADLKKAIKDAEDALDQLAHDKYPELSEGEIKTLVVNDKWLAALEIAIHGEMTRISQFLTRRVRQLADRYETPAPQMTARVTELEERVNDHLKRMGFRWN